ncbi:hypothetical protein [Anaerosporobacter sp.]|uniref:hypothetical protein n=1 Tax=Anaerosporobacter sp. TaxID=1872529 RepID=UPI00286F7A7E|nr:hypothetical protein [Anaerosporobacter sp.]
MDHYNSFDYLIRTPMRAGNDILIVDSVYGFAGIINIMTQIVGKLVTLISILSIIKTVNKSERTCL